MSRRSRILSEYDSKRLIASYGVPTVEEAVAGDPSEAVKRARALGFPVAVKLCAEGLAHKTERGLVRLGVSDEDAVREAAEALLALRRPEEHAATILVQRMVSGRRELILGLFRDRQFGACVMLGLGGIFAEALNDVVFRVAPLSRADAVSMCEELRTARILGPFRGEPEVDRDALANALIGLGRLGVERRDILSVDVNPMVVAGAAPLAVDALVETEDAR